MADFVELTDENFLSELSSQKIAIVDYYASWCGSCRMAANMFKRVAGELGVPIYKIDAEKNPGSRNNVTIENLPTIALFKDGKPVGSISTTREEGLKEFLKQHGVG